MEKTTYLIFVLLLSMVFYYWGKLQANRMVREGRILHSLPGYYGYFTALCSGAPALLLLVLWLAFESMVVTRAALATLPESMLAVGQDQLGLLIADIQNAANHVSTSEPSLEIRAAGNRYAEFKRRGDWLLTVAGIGFAVAGALFARRRINPQFRARNRVETVVNGLLMGCATLAIFTTIGIVLSVLIESIRFFSKVSMIEFLFGIKWSPQIAMRADQVGSSGAFGSVPLMSGTILISTIAMAVAVPIGLMSAIYLSEYATPKFRSIAKPLLEILAGIPTVVYGFFAALVVAPFIREVGVNIGLDVSSESALAAGLVMGIMIIPFVSSLSDDFINAVPQSLRDGAYALGATQSETIRQVVMPAALPGVVGGVLLAVSRAIGETMIVVMAAGLSANLTANPLQAVTTVTTQIVTLLVGDQEFDSPKTLAAFALGLLLFICTLALNIIALRIVRKYREQYE